MQNLKSLASLYSWAGQFESYLVANPEDSQLWLSQLLMYQSFVTIAPHL